MVPDTDGRSRIREIIIDSLDVLGEMTPQGMRKMFAVNEPSNAHRDMLDAIHAVENYFYRQLHLYSVSVDRVTINTLTPGPKTTPPTEYPDIAVHLYWSDDSALVMRLRIAPSLGEFLHQQRHMQARNARAATLPKDQAYAISLLATIWGKDNEEVLREFLAADLATVVDNELADEEGSIPRRDDLHGAGFYQDEIAACLESLRASQ